MSLKRNIFSNYLSQFYLSFLGIIMVPIYIKYMGPESYGLVGFFSMIQGWFLLVDMGLSSSISREVSRFNGGAISLIFLRRLFRTFEYFYIGISLLAGTFFIAGADYISNDWLHVEKLPIREVYYVVILIGIICVFRLIGSLYRGVISGFEEFGWMSRLNIFIATARFIFILPIFIYYSATPKVFFEFQLMISILELVLVIFKVYTLLPAINNTESIAILSVRDFFGSIKFATSIGFLTIIWVLVTQSDKLILSNLLSLKDYAYYNVAVLLASVITLISTPICTAIQPRLCKIAAEGNATKLLKLYRDATQLVAVVVIPCSLMLMFYGKYILLIWTGDEALADSMALVLFLYSAGNGLLAFGAFPYYLQFANGNLRLHIIGNIIFLLVIVPSIIWSTVNYGALGAGFTWLILNTFYFFIWVAIVHFRFARGVHFDWLFRDILFILFPTLLSALILWSIFTIPADRINAGLCIGFIGLFLLSISTLSSNIARNYICKFFIMKNIN